MVSTISTPNICKVIQNFSFTIVGVIGDFTDDAILTLIGTVLILRTIGTIHDITDGTTTPILIKKSTDLVLCQVVVARLYLYLLSRRSERMIAIPFLLDLDLAKELGTDLADLALSSVTIIDQVLRGDDFDTLSREVDRDEALLSRADLDL